MGNSSLHNSSGRPDSGIISGFHLLIDAEGGVNLRQIRPGSVLEIQTRNTTYTVVPQASGEMLIWGHPEYCPQPTLLSGLGGVYDTGMFREGYLAPGMRLSFPIAGQRVNTSRVVAIHAKQRN
jgi:hypothetical protein